LESLPARGWDVNNKRRKAKGQGGKIKAGVEKKKGREERQCEGGRGWVVFESLFNFKPRVGREGKNGGGQSKKGGEG